MPSFSPTAITGRTLVFKSIFHTEVGEELCNKNVLRKFQIFSILSALTGCKAGRYLSQTQPSSPSPSPSPSLNDRKQIQKK